MKKRIRNLILFAVVAVAIAVSLVQLAIPVVRAEGCPPAESVGCGCEFRYSTSVEYGGMTETTCFYSCLCGESGGQHMQIEREVTVYN